ncbi:hypothetical protein BHE74_00010119 [Ensete ventricosum]|nr:hypothetical protein BHE74_00010119 [Ensete ventricosum]
MIGHCFICSRLLPEKLQIKQSSFHKCWTSSKASALLSCMNNFDEGQLATQPNRSKVSAEGQNEAAARSQCGGGLRLRGPCMVIRRRKARRFPRDRTFASSTFSPLRMTTTPLFSAVSGRLDISSHPISLFPWVFHRTSKLILRALGWFLVPLSASGDGSLKKRVEGVMPIATGLVRKELEVFLFSAFFL